MSCGDETRPDPEKGCNDETAAIILVLDSVLRTGCGCSEGEGITTDAITCTIQAGKTVIFDFSGSTIPHQIKSEGSPSFPSSPPFPGLEEAEETNQADVHAFQLTETGTYRFSDTHHPHLSGRIIVESAN